WQTASFREAGCEWRTVVGPLHVDQGALQVSVVEQVADDDLRAGRAQRLGTLIVATNQRTDGKPAFQKVEHRGARSSTTRGGDENTWLTHRHNLHQAEFVDGSANKGAARGAPWAGSHGRGQGCARDLCTRPVRSRGDRDHDFWRWTRVRAAGMPAH